MSDSKISKNNHSPEAVTTPLRLRDGDPDKFRTFGRAKGRPLSPTQERLFEDIYPTVAVDTTDPLKGTEAFAQVWFEIGFGGSEHLIYQAQNHPHACVLGAEPFQNGVAKALTSLQKHALPNVRLHHGDARDVLDGLPDNSLDKLFVLFPDPWPKPKHHKRRIINPGFLGSVHRVLKHGGEFRFGSDIIHYVDWTLTRVKNFEAENGGGFTWSPTTQADWRTRPDDWPSTRYLEKALREGRTGHFFIFHKT